MGAELKNFEKQKGWGRNRACTWVGSYITVSQFILFHGSQ